MLKILLLLASTAQAAPIIGLGILNSPLPQVAKFNVTSGTIRVELTVGNINATGVITGDGSGLTSVPAGPATTVPASGVLAGELGPDVIASSVAVGGVLDASIVSVSGSKVIGDIAGNANGPHTTDASLLTAGTLPNARLDSSVTLLGATPDHAVLSNVTANQHHVPTVDTSAPQDCAAAELLDGSSACFAFSTLANLNSRLVSSIADGPHTTNTNAETICTGANVLEGSGACVANAGGIAAVVDDPTPELGGDLDGRDKQITNVSSLTVNGSITGSTVSANSDMTVDDDNTIWMDTARTWGWRFSTNHAGIVLVAPGNTTTLQSIAKLQIFANTGLDGSGTFEPAIIFGADGLLELQNTTEGNQHLTVVMSSGMSIRDPQNDNKFMLHVGGGGAFEGLQVRRGIRIGYEGSGGAGGNGIISASEDDLASQVDIVFGDTVRSTFTASGDFEVPGNIVGNASVTASAFFGDGSNLTGISTDLVNDTSPELGGDLNGGDFQITNISSLTLNGQVLAAGDSEHGNAFPGYSFNEDPDTGIYRPADGQVAISGNGANFATFSNSAGLTMNRDIDLAGQDLKFSLAGSQLVASFTVPVTGPFVWVSSLTILDDAFSVGGSTLTVVDGKVGVGTTSPDELLHIFATGSTFAGIKFEGEDGFSGISPRTFSSSAYGGIFLRQAEGTIASPAQVLAGAQIGTMNARAMDDTLAFGSQTVAIDFFATSDITSTSKETDIRFKTTDTNETGRSERMRLTGAGNLGIGTTNPLSLLDMAGAVGLESQTLAELSVRVPGKVGEVHYCTDCLVPSLAISSGTSGGEYGVLALTDLQ